MSDLTPPPSAAAPPLTPPPPVPAATPQSAIGRVQLTPEQIAKLDPQVATFAHDLLGLPVHSDEFKTRVNAISAMGSAEIQRSSSISNDLLNRPVREMNGGIFDSNSDVAKQLLSLRTIVEKLDPATKGDLFSPHKLLGLIPFGSHLVDYFRSYESSQQQLNAIIQGLYASRDQLLRDNAAIDQERENAWNLMGTLEQYAYLSKKVAESVEAQIATVTDPERAKILKEDVLFYARQKQVDIATQQAVNVQGYLALDLIRKNNEELVKGIDRATTTTVAALRTAVIVAQALANQKLVLDQVQALNTTTNRLIEDTASMLKQNTERVFEQASSSTVSIDSLKQAFADTKAAIDSVSDYKEKALVSFEQTVSALQPTIDEAKAYVARSRSGAATEVDALPAATSGGGPAPARIV